MNRLAVIACLAALGASPASAQNASPKKAKPEPDLETFLLKRGPLLLHETFVEETFGKKEWFKYKGRFDLVDGTLRVGNAPGESHHPSLERRIPMDDAIVQFRFKLDGAKFIGLSYDRDGEHIARMHVTPKGFDILRMTGWGKTTKGDVIDELRRPFDDGQWHTISVEITGKTMLAQIDHTQILFGERDGIEQAKPFFCLISAGDVAWFDDFKVWKGTPDPDWPRKRAVLESKRKR